VPLQQILRAGKANVLERKYVGSCVFSCHIPSGCVALNPKPLPNCYVPCWDFTKCPACMRQLRYAVFCHDTTHRKTHADQAVHVAYLICVQHRTAGTLQHQQPQQPAPAEAETDSYNVCDANIDTLFQLQTLPQHLNWVSLVALNPKPIAVYSQAMSTASGLLKKMDFF